MLKQPVQVSTFANGNPYVQTVVPGTPPPAPVAPVPTPGFGFIPNPGAPALRPAPVSRDPPMKELHQLLAVQDHDTRIDQLNHRRATMPERARLAELQNTGRMIDESVTHLSEERSQLAQQQRRLEDEIALVEEKRRSVDAALYGAP